jgi:hypothetical protein
MRDVIAPTRARGFARATGTGLLVVGLALVVAFSGCAPSGSAPCSQNVTPATFAAAYRAAPAGAVLCLSGGSYGTFAGSLRSTPVTIRAQAGASAQMALSFRPASNITIEGLRLTDIELGDARTKNITVRRSDVVGQTTFRTGQLQNANVLFDGNFHRDWDKCSGCAEGRIWLPEKTGQPSGITIQNSFFFGGLSDGIQNGSRGTRIIGNQFLNLESGSAGGVHADAIQLYGSAQTLIRGNWFRDLPNGVGVIMAADGADHEVIEDNVVGRGVSRPWLDLYSDDGSIVRHNTLVDGACEYNQRCGQISLGSKSGDDVGRGTVIENNVLSAISAQNGATFSSRNNLLAYQNPIGPGDRRGSPVYAGGSAPTTYNGFKLAAGSPGRLAASDGRDIGARFP